MYYLYILKSENHNRKYIGIAEDLSMRLKEHNSGKVRSTKFYRPYLLIYKEEYHNKTEARKREIELKNNSYKKKELFNQLGLGV